MSADHAAEWVYRGMWGALTGWFRVPRQPPALPATSTKPTRSFRPSDGWLRMRTSQFWIVCVIVDALLLLGWLVVFFNNRTAAFILAAPWLFIMIVPDVIAYIAIYLRYDTTWYVMSDRSIRIRRGIWVIEEKTFTFENVQNVSVQQGPVQRYFGVADLFVQTAGGGGGAASAHGAASTAHMGRIEGVADAQEIRELIMSKVRAARDAGLGDDHDEHARQTGGFSDAHLAALREIRDLAATLADRA
ncbi:MAG: PH domain-containing protein [Phycisphaerales bacterium]